ncbi:hypothetical protein [uncultured Varibaculum sp.]|uniref:hypothetical protein n=1 Tax=uncultured Varibaculum sp. TaxID=413896 RepID=UPI0020606073|nr:hypothetical protein [uncultured Varibaculum sp.]DAM52607.1 MAG TPA: hypothetical protein [Caudoviricetes sp.]
MLRNKDRKLAGIARVQSRAIADATAAADIDAQDLLSAGYDFNAWATSLTDEEIIQKIPRLTQRLDYISRLAVKVQKDAAETILEIYAIRETLEKLATRKINREKEEGGEC